MGITSVRALCYDQDQRAELCSNAGGRAADETIRFPRWIGGQSVLDLHRGRACRCDGVLDRRRVADDRRNGEVIGRFDGLRVSRPPLH
jgi:hypothetical protein